MKKETSKRWLVLLLAAVMLLAAGGGARGLAETVNKDELPILTYYSYNASLTSGLVSGDKGDLFAERGFQMEVWAFSPEKTNAILASGDLPDIMLVPRENLDVLIEEEMILNLDEYLEKIPHLYVCEYAEEALQNVRDNLSNGTGSVYGLPGWVGSTGNIMGISAPTDRYTLQLYWDVYEAIGAPEITDIWQLIDVAEQMVAACPVNADGVKNWGTVLSAATDANYGYLRSLLGFFAWFGYSTDYLKYLLEADMVQGKVSSILEDDSLYYQGLKWFNTMYRRGLLDPDSINADRTTQEAKTEMICTGDWLGTRPLYLEYLLPGTCIYYDGISELGRLTSHLICINANTEHLNECLAYLDIICNPDDTTRLRYGEDGDGLWYTEGNVLKYTDRFKEHVANGGDIGNFVYDNGEKASHFNTPYFIGTGTLTSYVDETGAPVPHTQHYCQAYQQMKFEGDTFANWQKTMGYSSWTELLRDKNTWCESSILESGVVLNQFEVMDEKMQLTMDAIKDVVITGSWKMIYAENDADFDRIWKEIVSDCEGLEAQKLIDWAMENIERAIGNQ